MCTQNIRRPAIRAISTLVALAVALASAGCVTTQPSPPATAAPAAIAEPPPSAYVSMLRSQGIKMAIPARQVRLVTSVYELIDLQDGARPRSRVVVGKPAASTQSCLPMFAIRFNPA